MRQATSSPTVIGCGVSTFSSPTVATAARRTSAAEAVSLITGGHPAALELRRGAGRRGDRRRHLGDTTEQPLPVLRVDGPHRAAQTDLVGDDIEGPASFDLADGHHRRGEGGGFPTDDALQREHHVRGRDHRVDGGVGHATVPAPAADGDAELVGTAEDRAILDTDLTDLQRRPEVEADDVVDTLDGAVGDHRYRARGDLLGGLEAEAQPPPPVSRAGRRAPGRRPG